MGNWSIFLTGKKRYVNKCKIMCVFILIFRYKSNKADKKILGYGQGMFVGITQQSV